MFTYLFGSIVQFLIFAGLSILTYQIFLSDLIEDKKIELKNHQDKIDSINKIAQIKLISNNSKDIENFITENAQYIKSDIIKKLAERIELIRIDQIISEDLLLKKRIENLDDKKENESLNNYEKIK